MKQTAANNQLLREVKKAMNTPIFKKVTELVNTQGEAAALEYLQGFFRRPVKFEFLTTLETRIQAEYYEVAILEFYPEKLDRWAQSREAADATAEWENQINNLVYEFATVKGCSIKDAVRLLDAEFKVSEWN